MSLPEFTAEEVASHSSSDSIWMVIDGKVYDVTTFQEDVSLVLLRRGRVRQEKYFMCNSILEVRINC